MYIKSSATTETGFNHQITTDNKEDLNRITISDETDTKKTNIGIASIHKTQTREQMDTLQEDSMPLAMSKTKKKGVTCQETPSKQRHRLNKNDKEP